MGVGGCEHGGAGGGVVEGWWRGVREITWLATSWRIYFWNLETVNCWIIFSAAICSTFRASILQSLQCNVLLELHLRAVITGRVTKYT